MDIKIIRRALLIVCALIVAGGVALLYMNPPGINGFPSKTSGKALIGGPFELTDHTGKSVSEQSYRGKLMLVFFGFTHCPDICPADLQVISSALDMIGDKAADVQPLFITIDPERDTQENLAAYMAHFHKNIRGLYGSKEQIARAAKAYRIYYKRIEDTDSPDDYTMDHTAFMYLMDRNGKYLTHFPYGTSPEKVAETLKKSL